VLGVESKRSGFAAWYRNPTGGQRALRIPYDTSGGYGRLYPDFIVVHAGQAGELRASIVDPHGQHLADAADKLRGLAEYAVKHGEAYARIIGVICNREDEYRMLDLKDGTIRAALAGVNSQDEVEKVFAQHGSVYG